MAQKAHSSFMCLGHIPACDHGVLNAELEAKFGLSSYSKYYSE